MKRIRLNIKTSKPHTTKPVVQPKEYKKPWKPQPKKIALKKPHLKTPKVSKRIAIAPKQWYLIMGVLFFFFILSSANLYGIYQQPGTLEDRVVSQRYTHTGTFDYLATLEDNTVYGVTTLRPGQGILFKRLIDGLNVTFSYTFQASESITIDGSYSVQAQLQTSYWTKYYTLANTTTFTASSNQQAFTVTFPVDIIMYETILQTINQETGVNAGSATLVIQPSVRMHTQTSDGTIYDTFPCTLSIPLNQNTIDISENLTQTQRGVQYQTIEVENTDASSSQTNWSAATIVLLGAAVAFPLIVNKGDTSDDSQNQTLKKIMKKYGEFIVSVNHQPDTTGMTTLNIQSIKDLMKVSEELGKPIIYYTPATKKEHTFYVADASVIYYYTLE